MDGMKKVPVREQEPKVRATNFEEVCYGYNEEEAVAEASRCLNCKNARCVQGCPVKIDIPAFVKEVKEGNYAEAAKVIGKSSALPAVCGRVCPQETSVKASASSVSRVSLSPSVSLSALQQIGQERTILHLFLPRRRKARRLLLSVPVLQD